MATIKISQLGNISAVTSITDDTLIPLVGNVLGTLTTLKSNIGEIKPYILGTTTTDIANVAADVAVLDSNLSALTNTVSNNVSNIASLQNSVGAIAANVSVLQSDIDTVEANVLILQGNVETINDNIDAVEANVLILQESLVAVDGNISSLQSGVSSLDTAITNIVTGVTSFGNLIPSIDSEYDLGASYAQWRDLYLSGTSIYLGNTAITSENNILKFSLANAIPEGNRVEWQVSNEGGLVFPDGTVQFSANAGGGGGGGTSNQLINGNVAITLNADGTVILPVDTLDFGNVWGTIKSTDSGVVLNYTATQAALDADPDIVAFSEAWVDGFGFTIQNLDRTTEVQYTWQFLSDGNLLIPDTGTIVNSQGDNLLPKDRIRSYDVGADITTEATIGYGYIEGFPGAQDQGVMSLNANVSLIEFRNNKSRIISGTYTGGMGLTLDGYGVVDPDTLEFIPNPVTIRTQEDFEVSQEQIHAWVFDATGNIVFPDNSIQSTAYRGGQVVAIESAATVTPNPEVDENIDITALAADLTIANPVGAIRNFQRLIIRIVDNGTPRTLTFDTDYIPGGESLPTTTVANKTLTLEFMYNSANSLNKWMLILKAQEA